MSETDLLERVTDAIVEAMDIDTVSRPAAEVFARAAIGALREADKDMRLFGANAISAGLCEKASLEECVSRVFVAIVDYSLREDEDEE